MRYTCLLVLYLIAAPAAARDIFVNNRGGDDRCTGVEPENSTQLDGPVRTIAKALRLARTGDRIVLAPNEDPYRESVTLVGERHSGVDSHPFVIEGNGATLDGSAPVPPNAWRHVREELFAFRPSRLGHQQLFLDNRPLVRRPATSLDWAVPPLEPLEWALAAGEINLRTEPNQIPQTYALSYAHLQTGITLYHVHDIEIRNLIVQGFQTDGISAHDAVREGRLMGVNCRGNGRAGITVSGGSRVEIDDSIIGDNGEAQLRAESYSVTRVFDCDLIGNTAPAYVVDDAKLFVDSEEVGAEDNEEKTAQEGS